MPLCAIIPVKPLKRGKSRLAGVLTVEEREKLNKEMLVRILVCVRNVPQINFFVVISYDPATLSIAREMGAKTVLESRITNLNRALRKATAAARAYKATQILIMPADLPLINEKDIQQFIKLGENKDGITISSDHRENGTNALLVNPIGAIDYNFGDWSFRKHIEQAERKKIAVRVANINSFKFDLDIPEDLELIKSMEK
jgi:2-phospho-L-lactate/phosphoenolpyruvate guanylyltransferase